MAGGALWPIPCDQLPGKQQNACRHQPTIPLFVHDNNSLTTMHLLVCVVNNTASVNDIVGGFVRIGVTGATVIDSHGTAEIAAAQVPVFAGFRHLVQSNRQPNRTVFSVIKDDETLERAMQVIEQVVGGLEESATGIMFAIPVSTVKGLAPKMEDESTDAP